MPSGALTEQQQTTTMTAQTQRLTLADRLALLFERMRTRRRRPENDDFLTVHLHDVPAITLRTDTGALIDTLLLGACLRDGRLTIHFGYVTDEPITVTASRQDFGQMSVWQEMPEPIALPKGREVALQWQMLWGQISDRGPIVVLAPRS